MVSSPEPPRYGGTHVVAPPRRDRSETRTIAGYSGPADGTPASFCALHPGSKTGIMCSASDKRAEGHGVERSEAVELIEKRRDAWLNEDLDTYVGLTAEEYVLEVEGHEELRGRAAFEDMIRHNYERARPVSWEFHEIASHGPNVLAEWTVASEEKASGARWSVRGMSICDVRNGVVTWWREYRSPATRNVPETEPMNEGKYWAVHTRNIAYWVSAPNVTVSGPAAAPEWHIWS
jgi:limonene-1,2-epoxide hydrolase